jgi:ribosome-associated protein
MEHNGLSHQENWIEINTHLDIPASELSFAFSRSSGPGGQNVNRRESQVELLFNILLSPSLSDAQRRRLMDRLSNRIDSEGVLHVVARVHRTQLRNRGEAVRRFAQLVRQALRQSPKRIATRSTAASRARRLTRKRRRAKEKQLRRPVSPEQD